MKKWEIALIAGMMAMVTGCSPRTEPAETTAAFESQVKETEAATEMETEAETKTETEATEAETEAVTEAETKTETEAQTAGQMDNFDVDGAEAESFARSVKEAVAAKDLEKLADLAAFPLYVGFADGGVSVNSREAFLDLGEEKIFTEELMAAVAETDETSLSPSRAGFVMTKEGGSANLLFGVRDGKLAVSGINY